MPDSAQAENTATCSGQLRASVATHQGGHPRAAAGGPRGPLLQPVKYRCHLVGAKH